MSKKKSIVNEPAEIYEVTPKTETEELHPLLVEVLKKSAKQAEEGKFRTTEEVMKRTREKFPFLK